jgi:hypothetical protein
MQLKDTLHLLRRNVDGSGVDSLGSPILSRYPDHLRIARRLRWRLKAGIGRYFQLMYFYEQYEATFFSLNLQYEYEYYSAICRTCMREYELFFKPLAGSGYLWPFLMRIFHAPVLFPPPALGISWPDSSFSNVTVLTVAQG